METVYVILDFVEMLSSGEFEIDMLSFKEI